MIFSIQQKKIKVKAVLKRTNVIFVQTISKQIFVEINFMITHGKKEPDIDTGETLSEENQRKGV